MSNLAKCLVLVAVGVGQAGIAAEALHAAETPRDDQKVRVRNVRRGEPQNPTAKRAPNANTFYRSGMVQEIHLQVTDEDLARMQEALPKRIYVPATFRWGKQTLDNVGVRYKGNSSSKPRQRHKRSFLIKFNEFKKGRTFLGLKRVALDNGVQFGSLFSEQLITGILHKLEITASRCNFAKLFLNDRFHGVYVNVERIDSVFLKTHFADASGALYKVDEGGPGGDLRPFPPRPRGNNQRWHAFEPKSKSARADARDVLELISKINHTPPPDFATILQDSIDVDAFLQTMAVMLFAGAFDQLTGWNPHNYYLYHEPKADRWHYLPWDLDVGFADNAFRRLPVIAGWNAAWPRLLVRYRCLADRILEDHFHPKVLLPRIDALYERVRDDLADDPFPHRRATNPEDRDFNTIVTSIKNFVRLRYKTARSQLDDPGNRPRVVRNPPRRPPQPGKPSKDAPTELRVIAKTASKVTLQWRDNADGEAGHVLQRADGENGMQFRNRVGRPGRESSIAEDTAVVAGRTYRYRVYAVHPTPDGFRGTGLSNVITVRVPDE